jgi:inner membrane protein
MEPITHFLTGACLGRAGLNRKTAWATLAATLAAEAADLDVVWGVAGPVAELKHHRGITHTLLAAPLIAAATVGVVWAIDRGWRRWHERSHPAESSTSSASSPEQQDGALFRPKVSAQTQEIRWGWLYGTSLLAALSHLFLDWTNNYGVRPFFPFSPRWYAGSFVFIADPWLLLLLGSALFFPWLLGLADSEIGARKKKFRGQGWAIFALCGMAAIWGLRWTERSAALAQIENLQVTSAPVQRIGLEPYPFSPFRWHALLETPEFYQHAEVNARTGAITTDPARDLVYKPAQTPAVEAAKRTPLGQVFLDWGSWAVVRDLGPQPIPGLDPPQLPPGRGWTTVEFTDLRWDYDFIGIGRAPAQNPLGGSVYIVDGREEAGAVLNGRKQR